MRDAADQQQRGDLVNSDDLTALLQTPPVDDSGFRQGVLLTYNASTGANTVNVGGAILTNLPFVLEGGVFNLVPGNVVVLMKLRSAWAILGRVVPVNDPGIINANDQSQTGNLQLINFSSPAAAATVGTINTTTPSWATKANFFVTFSATFLAAGAATTGSVGIQINVGATVLATAGLLSTAVPSGLTSGGGAVSVSLAVNFSPVTPGTVFSTLAVASSGVALTSTNLGYLTESVTFQKT